MATKAKGKPQTSAKQGEPIRTPPAYTCAMDKLRDEMAKSKQRYVQVVGEYLTDYLQRHPEAEKKLMAEGKSISGSLKAMEDEAGRVKEGNVGILDDATAFGIVLRYFGIEEKAEGRGSAAPKPCPSGEAGATAPEAGPAPSADPFDLDALMGGL